MNVVFTLTRNSLLIAEALSRLESGDTIGMVEHGKDGYDKE